MLTESFCEAILGNETDDGRFEQFAVDIVSKIEMKTVVPTSKSWDLKRDGRLKVAGGTAYVCSSLESDPAKKFTRDVAGLAKTSPDAVVVYICTNQRVSEHSFKQLVDEVLSKSLPAATFIPLSVAQLSKQAVSHEEVFKRYYGAELAELLRVLEGREAPPEDNRALMLALATLGHEKSDEIRAAMYEAAIIGALAENGPQRMSELARLMAEQLHLGRELPQDLVRAEVVKLERKGRVGVAETVTLTDEGRSAFQQQLAAAENARNHGRALIREYLETNLGRRLADQHFDQMWDVAERRISHAFFARGQEMVAIVSRLLAAKDGVEATGETPVKHEAFVEEIATAVAALSTGEPRDEIRTAMEDLFTEPGSPAFDWLNEVCASYVSLCSLGIEFESGEEVARLLRTITLMLDTDIVLSLLGEGEPNHESVRGGIERWRALRGRVLVPREVIVEVTHHASIADRDFEQVSHWLPGSGEDRIRYIVNVFVRSFAELLASKKARLSQWPTYIGQFLSQGRDPHHRTVEALKSRYGIELLPPATSEVESLRQRAYEYIVQHSPRPQQSEREYHDKSSRDASIYAALVEEMRRRRQADSVESVLLVSSMRRLADVERHCKEVGDPQLVVGFGAIVYLLSLVPGVSIGLSGMRTFLFDARRRTFSSDLERVTVRLIKDSEEVNMPWAHRRTLRDRMRQNLLRDAERTGQAGNPEVVAAVETAALKRENAPATAAAFRDALEHVALNPRVVKENAALERRLEEALLEVDALKRQVKVFQRDRR